MRSCREPVPHSVNDRRRHVATRFLSGNAKRSADGARDGGCRARCPRWFRSTWKTPAERKTASTALSGAKCFLRDVPGRLRKTSRTGDGKWPRTGHGPARPYRQDLRGKTRNRGANAPILCDRRPTSRMQGQGGETASPRPGAASDAPRRGTMPNRAERPHPKISERVTSLTGLL